MSNPSSLGKVTYRGANYKYTSWGFRGWACLKMAGIQFDDNILLEETPNFKEKAAGLSPTLLFPVLCINGPKLGKTLLVHDSLSIAEFSAEYVSNSNSNVKLWPEFWADRAIARSAVAEMHSGFQNIRNAYSCNFITKFELKHFQFVSI
ncbi:hypothetical protein BB558_001609 [Smittium angustum]|uniref:GST N-terminal domain-containing protein n=1 Tax=Smittium angustum TaxID=133377 RepID=A0A2U1JB42_SMIAN|nr:hypothetical protein BB558_001609 [Smittium angustum]